jgi:hypothetical protein
MAFLRTWFIDGIEGLSHVMLAVRGRGVAIAIAPARIVCSAILNAAMMDSRHCPLQGPHSRSPMMCLTTYSG